MSELKIHGSMLRYVAVCVPKCSLKPLLQWLIIVYSAFSCVKLEILSPLGYQILIIIYIIRV